MRQLSIYNPFNAPVYHKQTVSSTMEVSRTLARHGATHGTVIVADYQETGRGRGNKRLWDMERESGLPFTILLRYPRIEDIPPALTLRAGLAVSLAIEEFAPALAGRVLIKWPNDIMIAAGAPDSPGISAQKATGILAEADGGNVHIGIGMNVAQKSFPAHLRDKATSIYLAAGKDTNREMSGDERFVLLEKVLARLYNELTPADWKNRIETRLYKKGAQVTFAESAADSGKMVTGTIAGIGEGGELLIVPSNGPEKGTLRSFVVGELLFDHYTRDR